MPLTKSAFFDVHGQEDFEAFVQVDPRRLQENILLDLAILVVVLFIDLPVCWDRVQQRLLPMPEEDGLRLLVDDRSPPWSRDAS